MMGVVVVVACVCVCVCVYIYRPTRGVCPEELRTIMKSLSLFSFPQILQVLMLEIMDLLLFLLLNIVVAWRSSYLLSLPSVSLPLPSSTFSFLVSCHALLDHWVLLDMPFAWPTEAILSNA
jgi:hypothetical protein